jgi:SAV_6107-like HEPN
MTVTTERPATGGRAAASGPAPGTRTAARASRAATARLPDQVVPAAPRPQGALPGAPASRAVLGLLRQAGDGLAEAHRDPEPLLRYPAAYLAALRAAAAVLAVRARPRPRRGAPRDVWNLLAEVAPELGEWAAFFASCSDTRAAAEAGIARLVSRRDADDLLRQAEQFVGIVRTVVPVR